MRRSINQTTRSLRVASRLSAALAIVLAVGLAHAASPPDQITFQGQLNSGGSPANGNFPMTFRVFSLAVGGDQIITETFASVPVTNGLFTVTLGTGVIADGTGPGVYLSYSNVTRDYTNTLLEITVDGTVLSPRQKLVSAPYALNALRAETLDNATVADNSIWTVGGGDGNASFTIAGSNLRLQIGDTSTDALVLQSTLQMLPAGSPSINQRIFFSSAGVNTAKSLQWDEAQTRLEFNDDLAVSGFLSAGSAITDAPAFFHRVGTGTPFSGRINSSNDLFIAGDLEAGEALIANTILLRAGRADGFAAISFREFGSDTGENLFWDDTNDRFEFSDELFVPNLTAFGVTVGSQGIVLDGGPGAPAITMLSTNDNIISANGFLTIVVDASNTLTSGLVLRTNNPLSIPLLRMNSTNEANLELDAGVTTNAFDFAEAFRPAPGHESLEPGDVVSLATGPGLSEHCQLSGLADRLLLGVVSTKPAYTAGMSFDAIDEADPALRIERDAARDRGDSAEADRIDALLTAKMREQWKPIAMVGRVPTKVDGRHGPIKAGDLLTSSPTPGHAMKLAGPGMALGVALESFEGSGSGTISVFVRPMWHGEPDVSASQRQTEQARIATLERENADLRRRMEMIERALERRPAAK